MTRRFLTVALVLAVMALGGVQASAGGARSKLPFKATLSAPTHRPKVNVKWYYTVRVTSLRGAAISARITVQIRDPLGTLHPVLYANTKRKLVDWPIEGRFRDFVIWPRSSAIGISLSLRVTVRALDRSTVLTYTVTPRG